MMKSGRRVFGRSMPVTIVALVLVAGLAATVRVRAGGGPDFHPFLPNNFPFLNPGGLSSTFSTRGRVDLTGEYFQPQGTNGRSCATCHTPQDAWSINPGTIRLLFDLTDGTHPLFNPLDADNTDADLSTVEARREAYSMLLTHGVFRRGGAPRADREWDVIAVDDPHGFANPSRIVQWRRPQPTINFPVGSATVAWDGGNTIGTDQIAGLTNQATRNVTGAQQGPPATPEVIADIVNFETTLFTAQAVSFGAGSLHAGGARGGAEELSRMTRTAGRFDLFDAWIDSPVPARAQIARGQELFNNPNPGGGRCNACHNTANNGTNVNNLLFDVRVASAEARTPDLPLYTVRNRTSGEVRQLTDTGRGNVTGLWSDLGRFKTPTLRALAARAPYFHNGIAATLEDVVRHYETHLGFVFSDQERADLVAFLRAL
jgi:cytochrome c peroxidase